MKDEFPHVMSFIDVISGFNVGMSDTFWITNGCL